MKQFYIALAIIALCWVAPQFVRTILTLVALTLIEVIKATVVILQGIQAGLEAFVA